MTRSRMLAPVAAASLLACGTVPKEPMPDAAGDAPLAPVTVTTLTTAGDGLLDLAATVVFVDAAGQVVRTTMANDQGKAEATLGGPGKVHVVRVTSTATSRTIQIQTFLGVRPGDQLTAGVRKRPSFRGGASTMMTGTFTPFSNYNAHVFFQDCGSTPVLGAGATAVGLPFSESCRDNQIELLAIASLPDQPPRFVFTSFAHTASGAFTVPNTWALFGTFALNVTDVPAEITSLSSTRHTYLSPTSIAPTAAMVGAFTGDPPAGASALAIPYPAAVGARALLVTSLAMTPTAVATQQIATRTATVTASATQNAAALPLPWITARPAASATGVTWTQTGAGAPDLRLVTWRGRFMGTDGLPNNVTWSIADDGTGTPSVTLPGLPNELSPFDPTKNSAVPLDAEVILVDRSDLDSYDQARPNALEYAVAMTVMGLDADKAFTMRRTESVGRVAQPI